MLLPRYPSLKRNHFEGTRGSQRTLCHRFSSRGKEQIGRDIIDQEARFLKIDAKLCHKVKRKRQSRINGIGKRGLKTRTYHLRTQSSRSYKLRRSQSNSAVNLWI